jgi:PAS domain S-box-containing protein
MTETRDAARTQEVRFRTIFEQAPVSTQVFSTDGRTVAVNAAWEKLWGVTLAQLGEYNILDDQQLVEKGIMPFIRRGFAGEATAIPAIKYEPDKTIAIPGAVPYRWVRAWIYPVRDEHGEISEVVLTHEDITEQRHAEEALRESEERFRTMFYSAPVGISLIDPDGRYVAVNPARQRMLGFSEEELIGKHYLDLTYAPDVEYDVQINQEARQLGKDLFQLEKRFVRKDGSVEWARITAAVVRGADSAVRYSISLAEDITVQKRAEEERTRLLDLERKARAAADRLLAERTAILGQITDGIIITDPQGTITFANQAALDIHRVARLEPPGEGPSPYQLLTLDGRDHPADDLPLARAVYHGETVINAEWIIRRADGSEVVAQGSATPVVAEDGARPGAVLIVRDITAQRLLEQQKDDFLSALAHDLRTPLTTIKGRAQILRRRIDRGEMDAASFCDGLDRVEAGASRMIALINELLEVANIQLGRPLDLRRQPTDLVAIAHMAIREQQHATERHTLLVCTALAELIGDWDGTRLERMLANLLSNAVKYSPDGGEIVVEVDRGVSEPPSAILRIRDQGVGIPSGDLPHIFERFRRGANVSGKMPGTGIGLAAVRDIVNQHGGTIAVESEEGAGTTFTVTLPLGEPDVSSPG